MNCKKIKREARRALKHNYFKNVLILFLCTMLLSGGITYTTKNILDVDLYAEENAAILNNRENKTNTEIIDELLQKTMEEKQYEQKVSSQFSQGVFSVIVNEITASKSVIFGILNGINQLIGGTVSIAVMIWTANLLILLFQLFFIDVWEIGQNRYFLEQRRYAKTNMDACLFPYRGKKNFRLSLILLAKECLWLLWCLTIVGGFIKYYEYRMIPYILAENPDLSRKDAFRLSKELTNGHKLEMFRLDLSLLGWKCLGLLTFNLLNFFFTNIYEQTLYSEVYMTLRNEKKSVTAIRALLCDSLLDLEQLTDEQYPSEDKKTFLANVDFEKNYSFRTYILFFFTFSFVGWIWEVLLHIVDDGVFVNRGTMYGPWLPIYGFGGVAILFLLKRFRKHPLQMFLASFLLCGILEYGTAWFLETFQHLKYWDYSGYFLNLHGRVCLEGLLVFGLGGCGFTYLFAPLLDHAYSKIKPGTRRNLCAVLLVIFLLDAMYASFVKPNSGEGITTEIGAEQP